MAIARSTLRLLAHSLKDEKMGGACVTFGVQGIEGTFSEVQRTLEELNYPYNHISEDEAATDGKTEYGDTVHQSALFKLLGFSQVDSIDFFPDENPTFVLDLNEVLPEKHHGGYDMVYDGGTTEHCFDTKAVLSNVIRLLKPGGMVIHHLPISGYLHHGLYQFSPSLFFDFYGANGFTDMQARLHVRTGRRRAYYIDYTPSMILPRSFADNPALVLFAARKTEDSHETFVSPIQSHYVSRFGNKDNTTATASSTKESIKKLLRRFPPPFYRLAAGMFEACAARSMKKYRI